MTSHYSCRRTAESEVLSVENFEDLRRWAEFTGKLAERAYFQEGRRSKREIGYMKLQDPEQWNDTGISDGTQALCPYTRAGRA